MYVVQCMSDQTPPKKLLIAPHLMAVEILVRQIFRLDKKLGNERDVQKSMEESFGVDPGPEVVISTYLERYGGCHRRKYSSSYPK